jgi:hypothetical protein
MLEGGQLRENFADCEKFIETKKQRCQRVSLEGCGLSMRK